MKPSVLLFVGCLGHLAIAAGPACPISAAGETGVDAAEAEIPDVEGQPIKNGIVFLAGRFVPGPYIVSRRGEQYFINGRRIPPLNAEGRGWGGDSWRGAPGPWWRPGPRPAAQTGGGGAWWMEEDEDAEEPEQPRVRQRRASFAWGHGYGLDLLGRIERRLNENCLLIGLDDESLHVLAFEKGARVLKVLLSGDSRQAQLEALMKIDWELFHSTQWATLLDAIEPGREFAEQARPIVAQYERRMEEIRANIERSVTPASPMRSNLMYGMNLAGIVLGVVALGSLLNHRPARGARWSEVGRSGDDVPLVVRNVLLVFLLGLFDLACTLIAEHSGGFWEINPLGSELVKSPLALASFKVATLVVSCSILASLRRYRGAQVASWWLCLVCTLLAFRWATYNSLFLT